MTSLKDAAYFILVALTLHEQASKHFSPADLIFGHRSPSTPARPRSTSPTPIPSAPTLCLTSRSRSSSLLLAVPSTLSATLSAVWRYCSILCTPSANKSMFGSSECASAERCVWSAVEDVNVKADVGGLICRSVIACDCGCGSWRDARRAACAGSRNEVSISERERVPDNEGAGGGGMVAEDLARASQAAFSSSRLLPC